MKVQHSELINALQSQNDEVHAVYSITKEQVFMLFDGGIDADEEYEELMDDVENNPDNYIALPNRFDINEYGMMQDFIEALPEGPAQDRLFESICGKGAFRRFKGVIRAVGLAEQWYAHRNRALEKIIREWCADNQITIVEDVPKKRQDLDAAALRASGPHLAPDHQ